MRTRVRLVLLIALSAPSARADDALNACVSHYEQAQTAMRRGRLLAAREELAACLSAECPSSLRKDCGGWLDEVQKRVATLSVECVGEGGVRDPNARRFVDGADWGTFDGRAREIDAGEHTIQCQFATSAAQRIVLVAEGEHPKVSVRVDPQSPASPSPPTPSRIPMVVAAGVGVLGLASFVGFGIAGNASREDLYACKPTCSDDAVGSVRTQYIVADVSLAISLVGLGVAAWLALRPKPSPAQR